MSENLDRVMAKSLAAAQRVELLAEQVAALAIAARDQARAVSADQAALRERIMRMETLIDASMLFSLRDRQNERNRQRQKGTDDPAEGADEPDED